MRLLMLLFAVSLSCPCFGQVATLAQLRDLCVPTAPLSTLAAIIATESSGNPNAIQIDFPNALIRTWGLPAGTLRLQRQPKNAEEAMQWIVYLNAHHISVDVGLMQVSTDEATRRHISAAALLDPCTNVRAGWSILEDDYEIEVNHFGPGQTALQHALSRYNSGDTHRGIDNGYFARVMTSLKNLTRETAGNRTPIDTQHFRGSH